MTWFKPSPFHPRHEENLMRSEGDVFAARKHYDAATSHNLRFLIQHRFIWMNKYIKPNEHGIEVGCGTGASRNFINCRHLLLTDYADYPWLDVKNVDALNVPFPPQTFDFVIANNMIHHVPYPIRFFKEMNRILKPGGVSTDSRNQCVYAHESSLTDDASRRLFVRC